MPTAVVTGGAGFLGSHLCDFLLSHDYRVICVDNLDTGSLVNIEHIRDNGFVFVNHDLTTHVEIDEPVDVVFHLASPASPIDYMRLPLHTLKVGSYGTHNSLGLAKFKRARFLLASTSEVYGDPQVHPQPETYWGNVNPIGPRGVYDEAKRYAEAMTMAYHRQQGVDTCIARIFNSILADEQVLYDDGRELRRESVGELAGRLANRAVAAAFVPEQLPRGPATREMGFSAALEYPLAGVTVPAFSDDGRIGPSTALSLVAHPPSARCFEVKTRYGRSIRVTADHSLFSEGTSGEPVPVAVAELATGDRIAIARRIDVPERDRREVSLVDVWRYAEGDPWDLSVHAAGLGVLAWANRHDLFGLIVSQHRATSSHWRNGAWTKLIRMRESDWLPLPALQRMGVPIPEDAVVRTARGRSSLPARVRVSNDVLWLLGLFVAEGCIHERGKNALLSISCEPRLLDRAGEIVRRELGLHVVRTSATAERSGSLVVNSKLLLRMLAYLGFEDNRKRVPGWILGLPLARLKWFLEGYREGDGVHSGDKLRAGRRHEFSTVHEELKDDLIVLFARFGLVPSVGRYETTFSARTGDRPYPFWRLTLANVMPWSPLRWDQGVRQRLNARCSGDLVWATVTGIDEVEPTELVYDFSVPGLENFWAGSGLLAHNTFGPRMRPHDGRAVPTFLRQALAGKPVTVFGDGSQTRSFCYVDDLVRGLFLLAKSEEHLPVNLGNPQERTLLELARTVVEVTGSSSEIVFEALPIDDPQIRRPDITRASQVLGWEPTVSLEDGLRRTIDSLEKTPSEVPSA